MGKIIKQFIIQVAVILVAQEFAVLFKVKGALSGIQALKFAVAVSAATTSLSVIATALANKKPVKGNNLTEQRLNKAIDPEAPRKIVFGETIAPIDIRYWETYGTDNTQYDEVIVVATHEIESFGNFYLEDVQHTFDGSGISNVLGTAFKRFTRTVGVTATSLSVGTGTKWTSSASMTGMAFYVLKYVYSQDVWPQGFPNRITQVVKGAKVYDPRLDSTVPGGSGTHRINDQTTWQYNDGTTDIGRNPALQALWYLIGWRINGELVAGMGVETNSINLQGFIQAANDADTQGFFSDCALSTGDNHEDNLGIIESSCSGRLLDPGGLYTFKVAIDDTASIAVAFDENDIVGGFEWVPSKKLRDQANIINGQYIDPGSLYQPRAMPEVRDATFISDDGFKRRANNVYAAVQDPTQAQKLAWIQLKETRFQGVFKAPFNYRAFQAVNWDVVTLSLPQYNFVNKLFRIIAYELSTEGAISLTLEETDPSIYVTGAIQTVPAASVGSAYDPRAKIAVGSPAVVAVAVNSDGTNTQDGLQVSYALPSTNVKWVQIQYKRHADSAWITAPTIPRTDNSYVISPLSPNTSYDVRLRTVSTAQVIGDYAATITTTTGNNSVTDFANVGGATAPADNADVTDYSATVPFALLVSGGMTVKGRIAEKTSGSGAWDSQVYSDISYTDGAYVSCVVGTANKVFMIGLNSDPTTDANYTSIDYAIYPSMNGAGGTPILQIYESGVYKGDFGGAWSPGTPLAVVYDGYNIRYYAGHALVYTSLQPGTGKTLYLDSSFNSVGAKATNIAFGPMNSGSWSAIDSRPSNIAALSGTEKIDNSDIALSTTGQLTYNGGLTNIGAVTFGGLGGKSLGQLDTADWGTKISNRPTELTDGRVLAGLTSAGELAKDLKAGTLVNQGDGTGRPPLIGLESGSARDGDVITFANAYSSIPSVQWLPSGLTTASSTLTGDVAVAYDAVDLTTTGFTASVLLKELAGTPASHTDTGAVVGATYDYELEKATTTPANAWDDRYTFTFNVTVQNTSTSEPGQCVVGIYVKTTSGGAWVKYGTKTIFGATGSITTTKTNQTLTVTVTGVTDFTGVQFAVNIESSSPAGSVLTGLVSVAYETATAPNSANAVPVGASPIPYRVFQ